MLENSINDLLDLAKLENNAFTFANNYFNLMEMIYEAFQIFRIKANERNLEFKAIMDDKANFRLMKSVFGDKRRYL